MTQPIERRIRQLEGRLGVDLPDLDPRQRAQQAVESGLANLDDFRTWLTELWIGVWRIVIVIRSAHFRKIREQGWEPWSWRPIDVASDIASLPLDQRPSQQQLDLISFDLGEPLIIPKSLQKQPVFRWKPNHRLWVQRHVMHLALGDTEGLTVREEIANGNWDGSGDWLAENLPEWIDTLSVCRTCEPWVPLPRELWATEVRPLDEAHLQWARSGWYTWPDYEPPDGPNAKVRAIFPDPPRHRDPPPTMASFQDLLRDGIIL
jgi:hypothetical protein